MELGLKNKAVIVTGGGSNIGRAIVLGFAREGAKVMIGDVDTAQAEAVAAEAKAAGAGAVEVAQCDVTDLAQVGAMFKQTTDAFGGLDVLVNNVGWDQLMFFSQTTPDLWEKIIRVNFVGVLNCTYTALGIMAPQNHGAIVSISSDASRQGEPREAVYGGMKAGINSFMKTIAKENGRNGIRCNVVCPGVTIPEEDKEVGENSMWLDKDQMFTAEQLEKVAKALPLKKIGRPADVANAVVFLASEAAGHVTGQVLSVSGGYSMIG
ncbi:MAG: SDR family NAD(P)-dependent oxidoreductase [Gammaproteobacteria bacterium]